MAGRPRQFDEADVLRKAMELFWARGYQATSIDDLVKHTGLQRGSLYAAFSDKQTLYSRALELYVKEAGTMLRSLLAGDGSPMTNLDRFVASWIDRAKTAGCRGCMLTNSIVELSSHDPMTREATNRIVHGMEQMVLQTLLAAQAAGEIDDRVRPQRLARTLVAFMQGVTVLAKLPEAESRIGDVVEQVREILDSIRVRRGGSPRASVSK